MSNEQTDKQEPKLKWFFTFGQGSPYKDKYVEIWNAGSGTEARNIMFDAHGVKWAFCYTEEQFKFQCTAYRLTCLCVIDKNDKGYFRATDFQGSFDHE